MAWNDSGNKDPWSGKQQPPDLEEALKKLQKKLAAFISGKKKFSEGVYELHSKNQGPGSPSFLAGGIGIVVLVFWLLSGIFIVQPAEQAAILRFGKYVETVGPGPHWIPSIIEKKVIMNVDRVSDYSYSGQMLTKDENLVEVSIVVQYRIADLSSYLFNVADPEESLRQATSSALRQVVGTTTLDQLITAGREVWGSQVQESLVKILERYKTGIQIISVAPQPARAPKYVQSSFDDAIKAQEDERRFIEQARAYEAKVVPIAEGNAKRIAQEAQAFAKEVVLNAEGETAEFLQLLPQYTQAPQIMAERMYIETVQKIMSDNPKVFIDAKNSPAMYLPFMKGMKPAKSERKNQMRWKENPVAVSTNTVGEQEGTPAQKVLRRMRRDVE
jgi:membrane protease subunit HflK